MRTLFIKWLINSLALGTASLFFEGIFFNQLSDLLIASIIFGLLNTFIKPFLLILTLPINFVTLGLFTLVINAIILLITSALLAGFEISGFWSAVGGAIVVSIVSITLNKILQEEKNHLQ